jgi:DNA-binding NarL/FixJ family response regulator
MRAMLRAICLEEGHEVVAELGDGIGLLDYVTAYHPDVVCLDFNLPGANGLELLVEMDTTANHVDVIMITGSDDPELKGHAADLGATGFIHKPFEQAQIIAELKDIEETRRIAARAAAEPVMAKPTVVEPAIPTPQAGEPSIPMPVAEKPAEAGPLVPVTQIPERPVAVVPRSAVIIDDSGSIRLLLKGILENIGIKVIGVATNGLEGVEVVKKTHPALVCLDVDMPGMTGIEALPQVRAASPQTRVVMITGNASRTIVEAAVSGGAKGYFLKPIRPAKVEEFMQKLLRV